MPIYEYQCTKCSCTFEEIVSSADKESALCCPECKSSKLKKLLSAGSFKMSGSTSGAPLTGGCNSGSGFS